MTEEKELNAQLSALETEGDGSKMSEEAKEIASARLVEVHQKLADIDAETGPVSRSCGAYQGERLNEHQLE